MDNPLSFYHFNFYFLSNRVKNPKFILILKARCKKLDFAFSFRKSKTPIGVLK